ncbi:hypothetical protein HPB49_015528 [Dermacentor silvarum]|uniref:Uncharacterized protein n=1 Tax=Dermacentor silvarum TaxID=543639 RepID=A0ACB8DE22_DERSI|nr:hypothetical protein HPB49_015528 [Dermacentor silvarum]
MGYARTTLHLSYLRRNGGKITPPEVHFFFRGVVILRSEDSAVGATQLRRSSRQVALLSRVTSRRFGERAHIGTGGASIAGLRSEANQQDPEAGEEAKGARDPPPFDVTPLPRGGINSEARARLWPRGIGAREGGCRRRCRTSCRVLAATEDAGKLSRALSVDGARTRTLPFPSSDDADKLLTKLEEHEPELATSQEEECVVCVTAKASMQTFPCGHRVVCRKCFVKTIQVAVSQRVLPLRCVICRTKIVRLKHSSHGHATPVTPGARALLAPCEALGQTRPANPWPQDLRVPVEPLPASHYRHSAEACRFHRHRSSSSAGTSALASPEAASSSTSISIGRRISSPQPTSSGASSPTSSCPASPEDAPEVPRGRRSGLTRAVVHPPPPVRSPPTQPPKTACPPPPLPARSPRTPVPGTPIGTPEKEVAESMTPPPKTPAAAKTKSPVGSPKERSTPAPAKTSPDRPAPPRLQPPPPVRSPSSPTAPSTTANNTALCPAALSSVVLAPPPAEVRSRRGGQYRVSPAAGGTAPTSLPLTVRPPPPKPRPPSRFERFRDMHVRRPTLLLPIPEKEESEALLEAAFCRVAPGSSDLLVSASSPKIVLQDRAPLLQPDSPDRRRTSLRSQLRSKMAGFPSLLGSPLRALRAGARHRRVPDVN